MKRCAKCNEFFKKHESACPHCGAKVSSKAAVVKAAVAGAATAAALLGGSCGGDGPPIRPLYGVPIMDGGTKDGG